MSDAAKVIDWNGTDVPMGLGELLEGLPPGRYRIAVVAADDDGFELTPEQEEGIHAARRSLDAGQGISLAEADARWRATIAAAQARAR